MGRSNIVYKLNIELNAENLEQIYIELQNVTSQLLDITPEDIPYAIICSTPKVNTEFSIEKIEKKSNNIFLTQKESSSHYSENDYRNFWQGSFVQEYEVSNDPYDGVIDGQIVDNYVVNSIDPPLSFKAEVEDTSNNDYDKDCWDSFIKSILDSDTGRVKVYPNINFDSNEQVKDSISNSDLKNSQNTVDSKNNFTDNDEIDDWSGYTHDL